MFEQRTSPCVVDVCVCGVCADASVTIMPAGAVQKRCIDLFNTVTGEGVLRIHPMGRLHPPATQHPTEVSRLGIPQDESPFLPVLDNMTANEGGQGEGWFACGTDEHGQLVRRRAFWFRTTYIDSDTGKCAWTRQAEALHGQHTQSCQW